MENQSPHSDKPCIISTYRLTKTFGKLVAVNDLQLQVMRGDVFGFLGPNGSGKTTTIRMLLGLIRPTAGRIQLFGMDANKHRSAILPRIGAIIETPVFYPYLSGIDNLRAIAASSNMQLGKVNNRRINEVLDIVDLRSRANDAYRKYSLGMKQRLGIAAALLADPELVLLDEPTNGLDPEGVHEIRQLILRLSSLGKTIFLSSHILYEVQQVCNRVAILQKGNLLKQGDVDELLRQGEQLIVRMDTSEETEMALHILQQASKDTMTWISNVSKVTDQQNTLALRLRGAGVQPSKLAALLAEYRLFIAEMYPHRTSLEEFYMDVTNQSTKEMHPGMAALATATPSMTPELTNSRKRGKE
ncbi:MAG: ATP-binding cassette domain-containing protein [Ktedonobacteraceae bacterium]|nr:ATP-binding cassette domain-containing protein [Ktedonobacteraceae bacterium]MBV9615640.1 ATP-binding cassette domain-containing protein [Ktedonobacteraceae bacterium]